MNRLSVRFFILFIISNCIFAYALVQFSTFMLSLKSTTALMIGDGRIKPPELHLYMEKLGFPPNIEEAKKLNKSEKLSFIIIDNRENKIFKTDQSLPSIDELRDKVFNEENAFPMPIVPKEKMKRGYRPHPPHHRPPRGIPPRMHKNHPPNLSHEMGLFGDQLFFITDMKDYTVVLLFKDHLARFLSTKTKVKVISLVLIGFISFLVSLFMLHILLNPLKKLVNAVKEMGQGNLEVTLPKFSTFEFEILANEFNKMVKKIHSMIQGRDYLLRAVNHELRSPLARMRVHAEMIEDEKIRDSIIEDVNELHELVENLLQIEKIQVEGQLKKYEFNLVDLIGEQVKKHEGQANFILTSLNDEIILNADPVKIKILLRNLIENGIKYNESIEKRITINLQEDSKWIVVEVSDNGIGISGEHIKNICDPFFRVEDSRNKKFAGLGLGMNITHEIIRMHGGDLSIESKLGKGSKFIIKIPKN